VRLSFRFIAPLLLTLAAVAYLLIPVAERFMVGWFMRDMDMRAGLIANTMSDPLEHLLLEDDPQAVERFFARVAEGERLHAVAFCPSPDSRPLATAAFPEDMQCGSLSLSEQTDARLIEDGDLPLLLSLRQLSSADTSLGVLAVMQDMSFAARRSQEARRYLFYFFAGLALVVSLITVVVAQLSWRGWIQGLRALTRGEGLLRASPVAQSSELQPIADDLRTLIRDLQADQRLRDEERLAWSPETLREILRRELHGHEVMVVANREPYIHERTNGSIMVRRPASGVVTAMEPVMRACSGVWIAHGSGSADREVVDENDRVRVPEHQPAYSLRRIWLTSEEEQGYYYGFANEGLWPLCHISHVRPVFRTSDWEQYEKINRRFARTVVEEARSRDPIILVQDYHFALLPKMLRASLPDAMIITFWHIPWPNPEAFGICPWREELLEGILGSSILGFHTQFHCNNFVDTVDRVLEARIDRETFTVSHRGRLTAVKRYPISIEWPPSPALLDKPVEQCRTDVRRRHQLPPDQWIGLGIDRLDYTKGVEERFRAVERFLELHPRWVGKFTFLQVAAPTRPGIAEYRDYEDRVRALADQINERFANGGAPAIALRIEHQEPNEVYEYYRAADVCFISSLHDGMNLVAKEFVGARDDDDGVLILSQFTGAARELPEALIVNPYDSDQCAGALHEALTMPPATRRARMRLMRGLVKEFNVYRWAGRMLMDAAAMRRRRWVLGRPAEPVSSSRAASKDVPAQIARTFVL
jgi:trehalose 6-phosphate synthase